MEQIARTIRLGDGKNYPLGVPVGGAETIDDLNKHTGIYNKNIPVTLTTYATGKMLTAVNGMVSEVVQAGWGISRLTPEQFTFGDTVFLKMVNGAGQNLMVEGAVIFASEEEIKDADGQVVSRRVTSLFKASNTDVPLSGEVLKDLGLKGMNLLISHPLSVEAVTVGRSGRGASMATLESNMRDEMQRYSPKNARILSLTAGQAVAMEPGRKYGSVNARTGQLLLSRPLCDADDAFEFGGVVIPSDGVDNVSVTIDGMRGEVLGWNQIVKNGNFAEGTQYWYKNQSLKSFEYNGEEMVLNVNAGNTANNYIGNNQCVFIANHKTLFLSMQKHVKYDGVLASFRIGGVNFNLRDLSEEYQVLSKIVTPTSDANSLLVGSGWASEVPVEGAKILIKSVLSLDLTTLFPTPEGQSFVNSLYEGTDAAQQSASAQRVMHRLGFYAYEEQID